MNLRLKLLSAFAVLLIVFIMMAGAIFYASRSEQDASQAVEHRYAVVEDINEVLWQLSQMQTTFRSFMVTRDAVYLSSFQVASEQFDIAFETFKQSVLPDPPQFGRMVSIEQDARCWRTDILKPGIEIRRMANEGGAQPDAPLEFLQQISAQPGNQEITVLIQGALFQQNQISLEREQDVVDGDRLERTFMIAGPLIVAVLGAGLALVLAHDVAGGASADCIINLGDAGRDLFHAFLAKIWDDARQHISVNLESEFAVTLMPGELLANAARHAYAGVPENERHLYIRLDVTENCIRGELRDHGREFLNAEERLREALIEEDEAADKSGRGLRILASIADSVRYERTASGENVWFIGKCESSPTVVEGER